MRKCPQCASVYDDSTNFCLNDGSTLFPVSDPSMSNLEVPTIVSKTPLVTPQTSAETASFSAPTQSFVPPADPIVMPIRQTAPQFAAPPVQAYPPPATTGGGGSGIIYFLIGFVVLIILGGGLVGGYFLLRPTEPAANANTRPSEDKSLAKKDSIEDEKEKLRTEQDRIDAERKRLEDERKALEEQKRQTPRPTATPPPATPPPPVSSGRWAYIIDPPSNVRATPNGRIICVIRQRNAPVSILGSTGVTDGNGTWYYTDACGVRGVIHSSQFRY
jgi:hypothetical protein